MELFANLYLQILNLIFNLLTAFGADTTVVKGLIDDFNKALEEKETETV